ncbi:MAG: nitrate ABC transporter ATP-binding protein [Planctomycetota bacterium]|nr:nitrate ABC transporter ATP-binding protein [Planctomycetota bacterium]
MRDYVELFNLSKSYPAPGGGKHPVVERFNLKIAQGEIIGVIGHSGCGKSTVLSMFAGLVEPTSGGIVVEGREIDGPGPDRGVVFQSPSLLPWMTAYENVALGVRQVYPTAKPSEQRDLILYYLGIVGLHDCAGKHPGELSMGMQQRVGLARAFALSPKVLLLDEPFGMLDSLTRMELQEVLLGLLEPAGKTAMLVTHDVDEALLLSDRVVMMTNGPAAKVGEILQIPFPRPRKREEVVQHPAYYELRERLIGFLAEQERLKHAPADAPAESAAPVLAGKAG